MGPKWLRSGAAGVGRGTSARFAASRDEREQVASDTLEQRKQLRALVVPGRWKRGIAASFEAAGLNSAGALLQKQLLWPWARALNYHDVPPRLAGALDLALPSRLWRVSAAWAKQSLSVSC